MKDANYPLRVALTAALRQTGVPVFYMQAPDAQRGSYIVFSAINGSPTEMKTGSTVNLTTQITIYTEGVEYNDGDNADTIAGKIYEHLYPDPHFVLNLGETCKNNATYLQSDSTSSFTLKNQLVAIDRTITLRHTIFIA
jgi:hypothetical protein